VALELELGTNTLLDLWSDEDNDPSAGPQAEAPGTGNRNVRVQPKSEERWAALNMKGEEHLHEHQGHFNKRGTSSRSGLKQVNARRQPDKSLLQ